MANGKLFAFKDAAGVVWVQLGDRRGWIRSAAAAAQHQVDLASVAVLDPSSPLWSLPTIGPTS